MADNDRGSFGPDVQLAALRAELALERACHRNTQQELEIAVAATKSAWQAFALFEREILRVWRRAKKRSGYNPKPRKPRTVAA